MTDLVLIENRRAGEDRRQRDVPVKNDRRWGDRRAMLGGVVPESLLTQDATIVMLALLEGLADKVLSGDQWAESIQHAYDMAVNEYKIDPETVGMVINRVMEVKEKRLKDIPNE